MLSTKWLILLFFLAFAATVVITPVIIKFARLKNIVDNPGMHKTHIEATPLLGGLGIFISFAVILYIFLPVEDKLNSLIISTLVLLVTGLLDDLYDINPFLKLCGQVLAASFVVLWNAHLFRFMVDYFGRFNIPGFVVFILIIGWIVLIINAVNLIDGLDGLASGTAAIIFLAMALLSYLEGGRLSVMGVQLIGAGTCLGFLIFNFNPAKIFMGDTGSMLLGFILATSHLYAVKYPFSAQLVLGSMFIFAYPVLDVTYAIYRRIAGKRSIFKADKGHIHHVLISMGFSVKKTVLIIYAANIILVGIAVLLLALHIPSTNLFIIAVVTFIVVLLLFRHLTIVSKKNGLCDL
ncbi:MAG: MraY family glycosyltransferase [Bacillota bacterium]|nr:MraY family glycosyltransferase [Bacillota bacterium]